MICIQVGQNGELLAVQIPADGLGACEAVMLSGSDYVAQVSPWSITPDQGAQIASAILAVWALGYVFRIVVRAINLDSQEDFQR